MSCWAPSPKNYPPLKSRAFKDVFILFSLFWTQQGCPLKNTSANRSVGKSFARKCLINHSVLLTFGWKNDDFTKALNQNHSNQHELPLVSQGLLPQLLTTCCWEFQGFCNKTSLSQQNSLRFVLWKLRALPHPIMFPLQVDEHYNHSCRAHHQHSFKESIIWQGLPKNGNSVPNWKHFQISAASSPPGFKKTIPLFIPRSLGIAECELQELV